MPQTRKYEIELPAAPADHDVFYSRTQSPCDLWFDAETQQWRNYEPGFSYFGLLARKKRTLADWANEQELFKALAAMFLDRTEMRLTYRKEGKWIFDADLMQRQTVHLGSITGVITGTQLKYRNSRWELA